MTDNRLDEIKSVLSYYATQKHILVDNHEDVPEDYLATRPTADNIIELGVVDLVTVERNVYVEDGTAARQILDKLNKTKDPDYSGEKFVHIDDWLYAQRFINDPNLAYACIFLHIARLPALMQEWFEIAPQFNSMKLFCTYNNKRYRVTGASSLGDVWLQKDFNLDDGYTHRICITECSDFGSLM